MTAFAKQSFELIFETKSTFKANGKKHLMHFKEHSSSTSTKLKIICDSFCKIKLLVNFHRRRIHTKDDNDNQVIFTYSAQKNVLEPKK